MNYRPEIQNKEYNKKLSIDTPRSLNLNQSHSENNEEESWNKSKIDNNTLNLFKVKINNKRTLKAKKTPETKSNSINNCNDIFDFTNFLYNREEHLDNNPLNIIKNPKNPKKIISPTNTLDSRNKKFEKSHTSLELVNLSKGITKEKNIKKSLFKKNKNRLSIINQKPKRVSVIGNMTHKNRYNNDFRFFFKLKEKDKIPSKTPYLDKIWNCTNKLDFKSKTNIHTKNNSGITLLKNNTQKINVNKISDTNIEYQKEKKGEKEDNNLVKSENDKKIEIKKKIVEKNEENTTKNIIQKDKVIFSKEKIKKTNIIFNILNKPFFCCLK